MKTRNNKLISLRMAAVLALVLTTACSQVKTAQEAGQANNSALTEAVALINAKPEVVWSNDPKSNKIFNDFNTKFKISDQYFAQDTDDRDAGTSAFSKTLFLNIPDLKPLSNEKRKCQLDRVGTLRCFSNTLEIHGIHDLNRQDFKDDGIDENNYLNYHFDKNRGGQGSGVFLNNPSFTTSNQYSLESFRSIENKPIDEKTSMAGDNYFRRDISGNVQTAIRCTNSKLDKEYKGLGEFDFPTCTQSFILKKYKMAIGIKYERKYLPQWQQIQAAVESIINQFNQAAITEQGAK